MHRPTYCLAILLVLLAGIRFVEPPIVAALPVPPTARLSYSAYNSGHAAVFGSQPLHPIVDTGEYDEEPLAHDNISPADEQAIWDHIQRSISQLQAKGVIRVVHPAQAVAYGWPVRLAPGLTDYAGFYVSAFSDHDPLSGPWLDYNNGTRTYDTHRGTDIALWPFSWNKLDAGDVQVVAAAAGTIVENQNITPTDHNCGSGSGGLGNWIVLQHADGRVTLYGHMKYNSLTTKGVGQTVALGEYLGTVGSSGNASGPHVHFEVRTAYGPSNLWTDPYTGSANPVASSWIQQRPYYDSAINKIATATAGPVFTNCQPTVTNIQDTFTFSILTRIYFQVYYRDYQGTLPTLLTISDPNGNTFQSWSYSNAATPFTPVLERHWAFDFPANATPGTWRFQALYNGNTYETFFNVNAPATLTLGVPNGNEQWDILLNHPITWTANFGNDVNISLYRNAVFIGTITSATPNDGRYDWIPGSHYPTGSGYTIRITNSANSAVYDESNGPFTLLPTTLTNRLHLPSIFH